MGHAPSPDNGPTDTRRYLTTRLARSFADSMVTHVAHAHLIHEAHVHGTKAWPIHSSAQRRMFRGRYKWNDVLARHGWRTYALRSLHAGYTCAITPGKLLARLAAP